MNIRILFASIFVVLLLVLGVSSKDVDKLVSLLLSPTPTVVPSQTLSATDEKTSLVTKVIDGDTIQLEGGQKVRYIGIDTPELKGNECYGKEARDKNKTLVEGKRVRLEKDVSETDRYGRLLRFVYTQNGDFINQLLVTEGYAVAATFPPDVAKQKLFQAAQRTAQQQNRGLWSKPCLP